MGFNYTSDDPVMNILMAKKFEYSKLPWYSFRKKFHLKQEIDYLTRLGIRISIDEALEVLKEAENLRILESKLTFIN